MRALVTDKPNVSHTVAGIEERLQKRVLNSGAPQVPFSSMHSHSEHTQRLGNSKALLTNANNYILQYSTHLLFTQGCQKAEFHLAQSKSR